VKRYGRVSKRKDLLTKMIGDKEGDPDALTDDQISIEISNLVLAATDTSGLVLMYLFWELGGRPELQKRLRDEVRKVPAVNGVSLHKDLVNLPFLNACITETLRHWPPTPAGLLRLTPPGGATLSGVYVPERVRNHVFGGSLRNLCSNMDSSRLPSLSTFTRPNTTKNTSLTPTRGTLLAGSMVKASGALLR
jgi:hypothetical protein